MSTQKILIDYSEFKRLKEIEKKYHEQHSQTLDSGSDSNTQTGQGLVGLDASPTKLQRLSSSTSVDQLGTGASLLQNANFVDKIADLVAKRISQPTVSFQPTDKNWKFYEKSEPTVTSEVQPDNTTPPVNFSNIIRQNDLNDSFDENALLKKVPKPYKKKAALLLKIFDERPNELTWDSAGNVYADEQSIPNANIFELFPYLFRKRAPKALSGLADLVKKLQAMGVGHLINCPSVEKTKATPKSTAAPIVPSTSGDWWFLGS